MLAGVPLIAIAIATAKGSRSGYKSGVFDPPHAATDFVLDGSTGGPQSLRAHRGRVVALAFGFSYCPRICPVTLSKLAEVELRLGEDAKNFDVLFVTVDPERDSAARLREFLDFFNPTFVGATGAPAVLHALHEAYGVTANRVLSDDEKLGYDIHHSTSIYVIDRQGALRLLAPFAMTADDILHDVKLLLET